MLASIESLIVNIDLFPYVPLTHDLVSSLQIEKCMTFLRIQYLVMSNKVLTVSRLATS